MAIVRNMWLRGVSKKLAGSVYFQAKGRTLQRELAPLITNPRTPAQMATRVRLANLVQLYKAGRGWMKASFESKKQTQSDYNAFVSANLSKANVYLTKQQVAAGAAVVAPVTITKGSLPPITLTRQGSILVSDLNLGETAYGSMSLVSEISEALIENNPGIQAGDQLSVIQFIQQSGQDGTPYAVCRAYEMILDPNNEQEFVDFLPTHLDSIAVDNNNYLTISAQAPMGGYAFIISRTVGSTIRVSSQDLVLTADDVVYPLFTTTAAYNAAVDSYGQGESIFLSSVDATGINGTQTVTRQLVEIQIGGVSYNAYSNLPDSISSSSTVSFVFNENVPSGTVTAITAKSSAAGASEQAFGNITNSGNNIVSGTPTAAITRPTGTGSFSQTFSVTVDGYTHRITIPYSGNSID